MAKFSMLDLFSGCGCLSLGFERAGFRDKAVAMTLKETMTAVRKGHRESEPVFSDETFEAMLESLDFDINLDEAE